MSKQVHPDSVEGGNACTWARLRDRRTSRYHIIKRNTSFSLCGILFAKREMHSVPMPDNEPNAYACPECVKRLGKS